MDLADSKNICYVNKPPKKTATEQEKDQHVVESICSMPHFCSLLRVAIQLYSCFFFKSYGEIQGENDHLSP